jgi:hypothetical protein
VELVKEKWREEPRRLPLAFRRCAIELPAEDSTEGLRPMSAVDSALGSLSMQPVDVFKKTLRR